jgi:hypothetical protein
MTYGTDADLVEADGDMAGVPVTDRGTWMQCGKGRIFYPLDPRPEEVHIDDILTALSRLIRYNGLSDAWIVVAQHLCNCEMMAHHDGRTLKERLAILAHDFAETYIGDMIRPIKCHFPEFKKIEAKVQDAIEWELHIPYCDPALIKHYDNLAWAWEKRDLFPSSILWPYTPELPAYLPVMEPWSMVKARQRLREVYYHLQCAIVHERLAKTADTYDNWTDGDIWMPTHYDHGGKG